MMISDLCNELVENKLVESHKKAYDEFFEVKVTPKRGVDLVMLI